MIHDREFPFDEIKRKDGDYFNISYCELYDHYAHYVDEMGIKQPIGFELWVSEYLNDLIEVIK